MLLKIFNTDTKDVSGWKLNGEYHGHSERDATKQYVAEGKGNFNDCLLVVGISENYGETDFASVVFLKHDGNFKRVHPSTFQE